MKNREGFDHRVLIVDDEPLNIEVAAAFLEELGAIKIHYAKDGESAIEGVRRHDFDLILLDVNLPGMDGFEVCRLLKKNPKTADIPVIFMTAEHGIEVVARAFEVGGVDYLPKPFSGEEFKARVKTHLRLRKTLAELREKQSRLADLSITDPLTRCCNHFFFQTRLKQMLEHGKEGWLMRVHVGRLEKIDLLMGYRKADAALREMAAILLERLYRSDLCGRLYGAHFVAMLPGRKRAEVEEIIRQILQDVAEKKLLKENAEIEIVAIRIHKGDTPVSLMRRSNKLLLRKGSRLYLIEE
ncbi:MAG: response regulator [Epsilonproteobacteria bacterium]|nr:response regulator [Campylobacterota bacterium]